MRKDPRRLVFAPLVLPALVLAVTVTALGQVKWKGTIVKEGEIIVVRNPEEPLYKASILELKEELSIGGPGAQGEQAFGQVWDVAVDGAGTVYVLDERNSHVKVFDASGKLLRTIGRLGQGPGELERPMNLSFNRKAGELGVHQAFGGMSIFAPDGRFLRAVRYGGVLGRVDSRGNVTINDFQMDGQSARYVTKTLGPDGAVIAQLGEAPAPIDIDSKRTGKFPMLLPKSYFQIDDRDNVVYGYPAAYEILVFRAGESLPSMKILRDYRLLEITAEDKKKEEETIPAGSGMVYVYPKFHSAYDHFFPSDTGHLFVRTWEGDKDGKRVHDVFDAEGRFIGRVALNPTGIEIRGGKYYAIEEDEEGYQYVKRYAVTWLVK